MRWSRAAAAAVVLSIAAPAGSSPATATSAAGCKWQVGGTWNTQTLPFHPTFELTQNGTEIAGTETFSPADAAAALFPNPTAKVSGTLKGDQIDIIATFRGVLKAGRRAAGTLQSEYKGTVTEGGLSGTAQDITTPNTTTVPWSGTGPGRCVTRYLWSAEASVGANGIVRVWLPELPNGGDVLYQQIAGQFETYGLLEVGADSKVVDAQGKFTMSLRYGFGQSLKAPSSVLRTMVFDITSAAGFVPPAAGASRGGSVDLVLRLEHDNFVDACDPSDLGRLTLGDTNGSSKRFQVAGLSTTCLAGGRLKSGVPEDEGDLAVSASIVTVVIRKRP